MTSWPLTGGAGLARVAARRVAGDGRRMLAAWLVVLVVTTLVGATIQYADAVASAGLRRAVLDAPAAQRGVTVTTSASPAAAAEIGPAVTTALDRVLGPAAPAFLAARSGSLVPVSDLGDAGHHLTYLGGYDALEAHATLTEGRWPAPGADPIEATVSEAAARSMGVHVGDRIALADASRPGAGSTPVVQVVITGTWTADPADTYWLGDQLDLTGVVDDGTLTYRGPLMVLPSDLLTRARPPSLNLVWRAGVALDTVTPDDVPGLLAALPSVPGAVAVAAPGLSVQVSTSGLAGVLEGVSRSLTLARGGVLLVTVQFLVLAGLALVLLAGLIAERRRRQDRVLEVRGAGGATILAVAAGEALLLVVPAVAVAPFAAAIAVHALSLAGPLGTAGVDLPLALSGAGAAGAAGAGLLAALILVAPAIRPPDRLTTLALSLGRDAARFQGRGVVIDAVLVVIAGAALWQLRALGAGSAAGPGTAADTARGIPPVLAIGPAVTLLAGSLLATRLLPRAASVADRALAVRGAVTAQLTAVELARRPQRAVRATLLLMLGTALATLSIAQAATWYGSQADQAAYQAGADMRAVTPPYAALADELLGTAYRAVPGVTSAMPVARTTVGVGGAVRSADLLALDAGAAADLESLPGGTGGSLAASLRALAAARPAPAALPLPGTPRYLAVTLDSNIVPALIPGPSGEPIQLDPSTEATEVDAVVVDGDGRLWRYASTALAAIEGSGQRLLIPLSPAADARGGTAGGAGQAGTGPLRLEALEVSVTPPGYLPSTGTIDIVSVQATDAADAGAPAAAWTDVAFDPSVAGWGWQRIDGEGQHPYIPPAGMPTRIQAGMNHTRPIVGQYPLVPTVWRAMATVEPGNTVANPTAAGDTASALPAIAGDQFLSLTGQDVGGTVTTTLQGADVQIQIAASAVAVPPLDPSQPFLVVDGPSLSLVAYATGAGLVPTTEWWLSTAPTAEEAATATISAPPFSAQVIDRAQVLRRLDGDPVAAGEVGALLMGGVAALLLAAIGFLVSAAATVDAREDELGLARAVGVSDAQLLRWLGFEQAVVVVLAIGAGIALGIAVAWVVLPVADFTPDGSRPVPEAVLIVPWTALAAMAAGAAAMLAVATAGARGRLAALDAASVLREDDA